MIDLNHKSVLITGGTGSFGKKFVETIIHKFPKIKRLVIFSRDELKQFEMAQLYPHSQYPFIRFFLGDVRDKERLYRGFHGIEIIVHAAALKQVPAAEYNPMEFIKTNVMGAENIINAAIDSGVKNVVALSTDKAAAPINLYGATKLCSDKLFIAANNMVGSQDIKFSVVRYGNVIGSRGSVVPFFLKKAREGVLPITHEEMTRFNISLNQGIDLVLMALEKAWGGELFVPKLPSFKIMDLAQAIGPRCRHEIVGIRPGEKIHEEMITETDSQNTLEFEDYFVIVPSSPKWNVDQYMAHYHGQRVPFGFRYNSGDNTEWLNVEDLRKQIRMHVQPDFKPY